MIARIEEYFRKHTRLHWLVPAILCLLMALQMAFSVRQMSQHADESTHLYAGMRVLACGDYAFGREHPPLMKMVAAAGAGLAGETALCAVQSEGEEEADQAIRWLYTRADWWSLLEHARAAVSLFALLLCVTVWWVSLRLFGPMEAALAATLVAFEPNLLAHGPMVLNDVAVTLFLLLTIFAFYQWVVLPTPIRLIATGLCLGLALLSKHSGGVLVVLLPMLAVLEVGLVPPANRVHRALRNLGGVAAMAVLAGLVIWAGYGMRYAEGQRRASDSIKVQELAQIKSPDIQVILGLRTAHLLPQAYLDGLVEVHGLVNTVAEGGAILGVRKQSAPWYFFPLVLAVKLTLGSLLIFALGMAGLRHMGTERIRSMLFLLVPATLYLMASLMIHRISGIRHLLPIFSLLIVVTIAGALCLARRNRWVTIVLGLALIAHVGSSLHGYPNYLSYANEAWGGPGNLYRVLPGTDAAQGYIQVAEYMAKHPGVPCWVNGIYWVSPTAYVPQCTPFGRMYLSEIPPLMQGIVFVSGTQIQLEDKDHEELAAFGKAVPIGKIGGSAMLVYEGTFDTHLRRRAPMLAGQRLALNHGDKPRPRWLTHQQALEIAPDSPTAQFSPAVVIWRGPAATRRRCRTARPPISTPAQSARIGRLTGPATACIDTMKIWRGAAPRVLSPPFRGK